MLMKKPEFLMKTNKKVSFEELFPIISVLSLGQQQIIKFVGFSTLISFAESDEEAAKTFIDSLKSSCSLFSVSEEKVSVYFGVDRSLFTDGGVALTSAGLRKSASTGDNSWFSSSNIDPILNLSLHITAGSCAALAIGAAVGSKFATQAAPAEYQAVLKSQMCKFPTQQLSVLQKQMSTELASLAAKYQGSTTSQAYFKASQQITAKYGKLMNPYYTGEYAEVLAKEASPKLTRLGVALNVVMD